MENENNRITLPPEETVIVQRKGSYRKAWYKFIRGILILTNHSLHFSPINADTSDETIEIPLTQVHVTRKGKTLGIMNNRLIISDQQGDEYIFNISKRNDFLQALDEQMNQQA